MKNTVWGRQGVTRRTSKNFVPELEMVLEEIMKETYLNDKLVEDHFKEFNKGNNDVSLKEFSDAMTAINLDYKESEMKDIFEHIKGKEKLLEVPMIDAAVEDSVKRNIEELQKLILDDIYSSIKSDPLINFNDLLKILDVLCFVSSLNRKNRKLIKFENIFYPIYNIFNKIMFKKKNCFI